MLLAKILLLMVKYLQEKWLKKPKFHTLSFISIYFKTFISISYRVLIKQLTHVYLCHIIKTAPVSHKQTALSY